MLSNEKLDLLMIGSPNHLHLDHIKIGLNAGIKIFAEKPIVVNEAQSFELAKLLGEFGQDQVLVGLVLRYSQHARSVRNLIDKNILGRHPFPGPGLAIRILGDINKENVEMLQEVEDYANQ